MPGFLCGCFGSYTSLRMMLTGSAVISLATRVCHPLTARGSLKRGHRRTRRICYCPLQPGLGLNRTWAELPDGPCRSRQFYRRLRSMRRGRAARPPGAGYKRLVPVVPNRCARLPACGRRNNCLSTNHSAISVFVRPASRAIRSTMSVMPPRSFCRTLHMPYRPAESVSMSARR